MYRKWSEVDAATGEEKCCIDERLDHKFSKPGNSVLGVAWMLSTGKELMFLDKYRRYLRFDKGSGYLEKATPVLVEVYPSQLLKDKSNLKWGEVLV